ATTEYELDDSPTWTAGTSVAVTGDGVHTIAYRSTDVAGNVEANKTATVRIDMRAPVTRDDAPSGWSNTPVTVHFTAADGGSGVVASESKVDGAPVWTAGTSVTIASD